MNHWREDQLNDKNLYWRMVLIALACMTLAGQVHAQGKGKGRLKAEFDEELTPLQSAVADVVEDRKGKGKQHPSLTLKCANPASNNPATDSISARSPLRRVGAVSTAIPENPSNSAAIMRQEGHFRSTMASIMVTQIGTAEMVRAATPE